MLKIIYVESGSYIEYVAQSAAAFVEERLRFAASVGAQLTAEAGWASVLISLDLSGIAALASEPKVSLSRSDTESVEVSFAGTWLAAIGAEEGLFVTELSVASEHHLMALWEHSQTRAYSLTD